MLVVCALACSPVGPTPPPVNTQHLAILSKGGPPVRVAINGAEVVALACNGGVAVRPGENGAPPLPWDIMLTDENTGRVMLEKRITELPRWLVIFRDSAGVSASPISGPFVPCAAS
jgi:hypothetical protein